MQLTLLNEKFAVLKTDYLTSIPSWITACDFYSITKTYDEVSIIMPQQSIPEGLSAEKNFAALKVDEILDFSLIGIISKISTLLAAEKISIFVFSTFNTDYFLIREQNIENAVSVLTKNGYKINRL